MWELGLTLGKKDIIYTVGSVNNNKVQALCFVFGTVMKCCKQREL